MKIRKNARWLIPYERNNFLKAVVTLKSIKLQQGSNSMRLYDFYPLEHRLVRERISAGAGAPMGDGGHTGPGFPSWHREWLLRFEEDLRSVDSTVTLPYWDLTDQENSTNVLFQADFMGGNGSGRKLKIQSGVFQEQVPDSHRPSWWPDDDFTGKPLSGFIVSQGLTTVYELQLNHQPSEFNTTGLTRDFTGFSSLPSRNSVRKLLASKPFLKFEGDMEGEDYHVPGHNLVGGLMRAPHTSPNDPIFFLHHAGVDLIWALWQDRHDQSDPKNLPPSRLVQPEPKHPYGHCLEDFMWPWDGTTDTNPNKARPPDREPFPPNNTNDKPPVFPSGSFVRNIHPEDMVRVKDVIDHRALDYQYDVEIPFDLEKKGTKVARIEAYFGDLSLTGTVVENSGGNAKAADLAWELNGTTLGWIDGKSGNLHIKGKVVEDETDFSDTALAGAIDFRHYNQPLAYLDVYGNFHLKGRVLINQPPIK